jgi:hypothetical protein
VDKTRELLGNQLLVGKFILGNVFIDSLYFFFLDNLVDFIETSDEGLNVKLSNSPIKAYSTNKVDVN